MMVLITLLFCITPALSKAEQTDSGEIIKLREEIRINQNSTDAHKKLGNIYLDLKRYDEAIIELKEAIRLNPNYAPLHNNLGLAYFESRLFKEAIAEFKEAVRIDPSLANAHLNLGHIYSGLNLHNEARIEYNEYTRLDKNTVQKGSSFSSDPPANNSSLKANSPSTPEAILPPSAGSDGNKIKQPQYRSTLRDIIIPKQPDVATDVNTKPKEQSIEERRAEAHNTEQNLFPLATRGIIPVKIYDKKGKHVGLYKESHALVIGVSNYTNGWPQLPGVMEDVAEVKKILSRLGFAVTELINPTRDELNKAFESFIDKYGLDKDNRLLFYFAGHGHTLMPKYGGPEMGYIVPKDTPNPNNDERGFLRLAMSMQSMETYARNIQSKHALFLFDSCFSGSIFALSRSIPEIIREKSIKPVRQFITAGKANQEVPDKSIFRRQFVVALEGGADLNKDGYITASELGQFLEDSVTKYSRGSQIPQFGKLRDPALDQGDFIFNISVTGQAEAIKENIAKESTKIEQDILEEQTKRAKALKELEEAQVKFENNKKKIDEERARTKTVIEQAQKEKELQAAKITEEEEKLRQQKEHLSNLHNEPDKQEKNKLGKLEIVTQDRAKVHRIDSYTSSVIGYLTDGQIVPIIEIKKTDYGSIWYKILLPKGGVGWILNKEGGRHPWETRLVK